MADIERRMMVCQVVGDSGVGKSSLLLAYGHEKVSKDYMPAIIDTCVCVCVCVLMSLLYSIETCVISDSIDGVTLSIQLGDSNADEIREYATQTGHKRTPAIQAPDVVLVCYSVVDRQSFNNTPSFADMMRTRYGQSLQIALIGLKNDLRRTSDLGTGQANGTQEVSGPRQDASGPQETSRVRDGSGAGEDGGGNGGDGDCGDDTMQVTLEEATAMSFRIRTVYHAVCCARNVDEVKQVCTEVFQAVLVALQKSQPHSSQKSCVCM
ncbi:rho-related GTP-binding protein RhoG-like isoform X1 [Sycon ciliatum]|uniref:rho-related GTP-binding protein RhoG-like isoform X1 n=1 Tax=Sycon ciliatum TaxID=27933 RepID=UPI0031F700A9